MTVRSASLSGVLLLMLGGCATTSPNGAADATAGGEATSLASALGLAPALTGPALAREVALAAAYPLGSQDNPVRAAGPPGQRAYLSRLRCADTARPEFERHGSYGLSRYGSMMDAYGVTCGAGDPEETIVYMDMYHDHVETAAVPGFGIMPASDGGG